VIDIVIPVLARPDNAQPLVDSIRKATTVPYTITFMVSPGDDAELEACLATGAIVHVVDWEPGPADASRKWNLGYTMGSNPFVLLAADDLEFEPGWDVAVLKQADRSGAGVIGTNDQANPLVMKGKHSTHPVVRRSYIDAVGGTFFDGPGFVYHEGYDHQAVDNELYEAAVGRKEWAFAMTSIVRHMHPIYPHRGRSKTMMDDTYRRAMAEGSADIKLFKSRLERWNERT
jgi:glycosyltransferase involved in cell wall biosynthesis